MKRVAILQSNYIPWKGYFDIINDVDLFVFYDEVQYTKGDWRNRNKIITNSGELWLTVPVGDNVKRSIKDVKISENSKWQNKHWNSILRNYSKSKYFNLYKDFFQYVYLERKWDYLYELNRYIIENISREFLDIKTSFIDSTSYNSKGKKHKKLLSLVEATGATIYVSGPAAKDYIVEKEYKEKKIDIIWKDYSDYPAYPQRGETFTHNVSVLDLLFNTGSEAKYYIWGHRYK